MLALSVQWMAKQPNPCIYKANTNGLSEVSMVKEGWPLAIGSGQYKISFQGFVNRARMLGVLQGKIQTETFDVKDFPKTNILYSMEVTDPGIPASSMASLKQGGQARVPIF
jgi:hypothetical protein